MACTNKYKDENGYSMEDKEKLFAELYVLECGFNATEAYRKMRLLVNPEGGDKTDRRNASRFKNRPGTLKAIDALKAELRRDYDIDKDEIVSKLKDIAFPSPGEKIPIKTQMSALDMLNKMGGLYTSNLNVDANAEIEVVIE